MISFLCDTKLAQLLVESIRELKLVKFAMQNKKKYFVGG